MIVFWFAAIVIGILVTMAIFWQVISAITEHRDVTDDRDEHVYDFHEGSPPHVMGRTEQGADAVLRNRVARGEISEETYDHLMHDLHPGHVEHHERHERHEPPAA